MKRASKAPASRYCHWCHEPVLTARESLFMNVDGEKRLFHQELCYGHWQAAVAARAREEARKANKRQIRARYGTRYATAPVPAAVEISKPHTQQQLSDVSLRDLLIEVANRIGARLDGIEQSGLRLQALVDQLLRGGRA